MYEYESNHKCIRCGGNVSEAEDCEAQEDENYMPYCDSCADAMTTQVDLYEDNAGHLYLICSDQVGYGTRGWADVEAVIGKSTFAEDASAIVHGNTGDWTLREMTAEEIKSAIEDSTLIATYLDQEVTPEVSEGSGELLAGSAAQQYMEQQPNLDDWLTPVEVAAKTGTAESTWRNKAARGEIPGAVKKGKQWLIPRAAISK